MFRSESDTSDSRLEDLMNTPGEVLTDIISSRSKIRACVYIRQIHETANAFIEVQEIRSYYNGLFDKHTDWQLSDFFEDDGKSNFELHTMIRNAKQGKYDIIITPSFHDFCVSGVDSVDIIMKLKRLSPPLGIFFETEDFFSLEEEVDSKINLMLFLMKQEKLQKSRVMRFNTSIKPFH